MASVQQQLQRFLDQSLGDDPRQALIAAHQLGEEREWLLQRAVALARREQWSWSRIGRLLGVSRQAARQKFDGVPPRLPPHQRADHRSPLEQQARETERVLRDIRNGTWRPDQGDDGGDVVPW